jgi:hypothetical protein
MIILLTLTWVLCLLRNFVVLFKGLEGYYQFLLLKDMGDDHQSANFFLFFFPTYYNPQPKQQQQEEIRFLCCCWLSGLFACLYYCSNGSSESIINWNLFFGLLFVFFSLPSLISIPDHPAWPPQLTWLNLLTLWASFIAVLWDWLIS